MSERSNRPSGPPSADDLLAVLLLRKPKGLRGEARCDLLTPEIIDLRTLIEGRVFWLRVGSDVVRAYELEYLVPYQDSYLVKIGGVDVREELDALRGGELCLKREDLPPLPDGWFWENDIIGIDVIDESRGRIGKIIGLDTIAGRQSILIETSQNKQLSVPLVPALFPILDTVNRQARTDLPQEFPNLDD